MRHPIKHALIALTLIAAMPAASDEPSNHTMCTSWSELAETIAGARYNGVRIRALMDAADNPYAQRVIRDAYALPNYTTETHQHRAISQFSDDVYVQCLTILERADKAD